MLQQKKTPITEEGLKKLQDEIQHLKTERRHEVAQAIQTAKEQGDLSENAEYVDAKEEQAQLEQRIVDLEATLKNVEVIQKSDSANIQVGTTVTVHMNDKEQHFTIVGPNEVSPADGRISNESPLGTALLGKKPGETFSLRTPGGQRNVKIVKVA